MNRVQICFRTDSQPKLKPQRAHRAKMHKNRQFCKYATQSIPGPSFNLLCLYYLPVPILNPKESSLLKEISLLPAVGMFSKLSCDNCCLAQPQTRSQFGSASIIIKCRHQASPVTISKQNQECLVAAINIKHRLYTSNINYHLIFIS